MICHQLYYNWTSFGNMHSIFSKLHPLLVVALLARHLTFFDSFLIWDMWITISSLHNFQTDRLGQMSKCWVRSYDDEFNRIYAGLAWTPTISSLGIACCDFRPPKPPNGGHSFET